MENTTKIRTVSKRFLAEIRETLSEQGFSSEDFTISSKNKSNVEIDIIYKYNHEYYFNASMLSTASDIYITYSPGEIMSPETDVDLSKDEYLEAIDNWIIILREELKSTTLGRQVYENEEKLKDLERFIHEKFSDSETTYFSKEEGEKFKARLDEFEKMFQEQIKQQNAEDKKIHKEIELLKEQIDYLPKGTWATAIGAKLLNWGYRNPRAVKQVGQVAMKALLPKELENSLPELLPPSNED
ncbi:hypothetical protein JNUCC23_23260 (plasmid) [Peribacillus sp. JNUCC 23]